MKIKDFGAIGAAILVSLSVFSSCADKPELLGEWQGENIFEAEVKSDAELLSRYEEYKQNSAKAFSGVKEANEEDFELEENGGGVKITRYKGSERIVVLPESIAGKRVNAVGKNAFTDTNVRAVRIPESVEIIERSAFEGCDGLSTLSLPFIGDGENNSHFGVIFGAETHENNAVSLPASLDMVIIGEGQKNVEDNAFSGCKSISAIVLPESIESIGSFAFYQCRDLVFVDIKSDKCNIGSYAFAECGELYSFELKDADSIGRGAFYSCDSLEELTLPFVGGSPEENSFIGYIFGAESVEFNGEYVPVSLSTVNVSGSEIPDRGFYACEHIDYVNFDDGIERIGTRAFYRCRSLLDAKLPASLKEIGDDAFFSCDNLSSVSLGEALESIGIQAFFGCRSLKSIIIPERISEIKASTFAYCISLETAELNNVKKIDKDAFYSCNSLNPVNTDGISVAEGNDKIILVENEED